jgi:hypothetical protein
MEPYVIGSIAGIGALLIMLIELMVHRVQATQASINYNHSRRQVHGLQAHGLSMAPRQVCVNRDFNGK